MSHSALAEQESSGIESEPIVRVPVSGGVLVYERTLEYNAVVERETETSRRLIGYEDVEDWSELKDAVIARGHGRGNALHLPELDGDAR